jgi:hypothetical protein
MTSDDLLKAGFFYSGSKQLEDLQWLGNFTKSIEDLDRQMVTNVFVVENKRVLFGLIILLFIHFHFVCFRTLQHWSY